MSKILNNLIVLILLSFTISQGCKENENFCIKCYLSNSLCYKCEYDILTPDENGGCVASKKCKIGNNFCDKCNEDNTLCQSCENCYYPDKNGGCSYINNCEISYNGECLKCVDNFILIGESNSFKLCKSTLSTDLKNCKSIDKTNGLCQSCEEGYYLNKGDKKCSNIENCYESSYGKCKKCNSGYYLNKKDEKCLLQDNQLYHCQETIDGKNCDKCDIDYYLDKGGKCVSTNYCSKSENFKCVECLSNYYLTENGEECSTEKNCFSADKELGYCTSCKSNYYLDLSKKECILNDKDNEFNHCKKANDKCIECESGFYLADDNKCTITKNCAEANEGVCDNV